jgi:hypothetical protein
MSKKGLYHSELAKMSPLTAKILSEPTESRFPDRPKWIALEIEGEERFLNCENVGIELVLTGLKGQWAKLNAKGRGEEAVIEIEDAEGKEEVKKAETSSSPSKPATAGKGNGDKIKDYAAHSLRIFNIAWEESHNWVTNIPEKDAVELSVRDWYDLRLRVAQGLSIEINKIIRKERF